jgi:hypothetical protein
MKLTCSNCKTVLRRGNKTGYCWGCFQQNVDSIRTRYNRNYRKDRGLYDESAVRVCSKCGKQLKKVSRSGACAPCFHKNVDGIKTNYNKQRWESGVAKKIHWKGRGATVTAECFLHYEKTTKCGICGSDFRGDKVLDHCHETGTYRGALCRQCNAALGKLGDSIDLVVNRLMSYKELKLTV